MGLTAAGRVQEAERAYEWLRRAQRPDGTWAARYHGDTEQDPTTSANFCAYVATGVRHHWIVTGDDGFLSHMWPTVRSAIEAVLTMQAPRVRSTGPRTRRAGPPRSRG